MPAFSKLAAIGRGPCLPRPIKTPIVAHPIPPSPPHWVLRRHDCLAQVSIFSQNLSSSLAQRRENGVDHRLIDQGEGRRIPGAAAGLLSTSTGLGHAPHEKIVGRHMTCLGQPIFSRASRVLDAANPRADQSNLTQRNFEGLWADFVSNPAAGSRGGPFRRPPPPSPPPVPFPRASRIRFEPVAPAKAAVDRGLGGRRSGGRPGICGKGREDSVRRHPP